MYYGEKPKWKYFFFQEQEKKSKDKSISMMMMMIYGSGNWERIFFGEFYLQTKNRY